MMRLLRRKALDNYELVNFINTDDLPPYAVLSHTWIEGEEVTYDELQAGIGTAKPGWAKIRFCGERAFQDGIHYFWVDTCCINGSTERELSTAINSMFRWYQRADKCYVYLSDVQIPDEVVDVQAFRITWEEAFRRSRWFRRGWTLQELLAPATVEFYCKSGKQLGSKITLEQEIFEITNIPIDALQGGGRLSEYTVEERMKWAASRETTITEDKAYCLLGIFGVFLPLIYGEGVENAFRRLKKEIQESLGEKERRDHECVQPLANTTVGSAVARTIYIPFFKNYHFVGRRVELGILERRLLVDRDCGRISIAGLGGTGKTQVALQFAVTVEENRSDYSIFWVSALSIESFEQACTEIARKLGITQAAKGEEDAKELVKQYLSTARLGRWLLVVDNADDSEVLFGKEQSKGLVEYLPQSKDGVILFTTRTYEVATSLTGGDVIELEAMSREEAGQFLEKALIQKDLLCNGEAVAELLNELACLPLAIAQAAAYLNSNRTSISEYLRLLSKTDQDIIRLMSREFRDNTRYEKSANAIATTWVVSFEQIRKLDPAAEDLLSFMSCIEWKAIPSQILPTVQPEERITQAIGTLRAYSFVVRRKDENQVEHSSLVEDEDERTHVPVAPMEESDAAGAEYDMHRLVHLATKIWISRSGRTADVTAKAIRHVADLFPSDDYANRWVWRAYLPHALRLLSSEQGDDIKERYKLCFWVGRCLRVDGRIREAVAWLEEVYKWESNFAEDHPSRLAWQHALAEAYRADGQVKKAASLLEHVVAVREKVLTEDHPDRLASQRALAVAYRADGQVKKAVSLLEHLAVREKVLTEDQPHRLASQLALALAYRAEGKVKKAVALLEHIVTIVTVQKPLAEDHPFRLASQHALAAVYQVNGQVKQALTLLKHVVAVREKVLAEDHPSLLDSQHELAKAYRADGQVKKAVALQEHVVAVRKKVLTEDHPSLLDSQHELARAYRADGQVKKAVVLLEHVVAIREKVLAEDHPSRLASQYVLAVVYQVDEQVKKALALLEHVVAVREKVLAEDHPSLLNSQCVLAEVYYQSRQVEKAVALLEHVVAVREKVLAEDHPDRQIAKQALAALYTQQGSRRKGFRREFRRRIRE